MRLGSPHERHCTAAPELHVRLDPAQAYFGFSTCGARQLARHFDKRSSTTDKRRFVNWRVTESGSRYLPILTADSSHARREPQRSTRRAQRR
jgi:hypothetical protein